MTGPIPTPQSAAAVFEALTGLPAVRVNRFSTGAAHYVYEVWPADGQPVVVRMGRTGQREELQRGLVLMQRLAGLGVPLPRIIASRFDGDFPAVVMARLPGTDLGQVMDGLTPAQLAGIAGAVAGAQFAASRSGSAGRYGFAAAPEDAPHAQWSDVIAASLTRSRRRMESAGFFDMRTCERVATLIELHRAALDAQPAVPFLHDTTVRNVIVGPDGRFSGIVDVDDLCFGDPRFAPALTLAVMEGYGGPVGYVGEWMRVAGLRDDVLFRLYVALFLLDLMSEHGLTFNGNEAVSTEPARKRLSEAFERVVDSVN